MCTLAFLENEFRFKRHTKQSFVVDGNMQAFEKEL